MTAMPRAPREEVEDGIQHVYARGNDRRRVFFADVDRRIYLATLGRTVAWAGWHCLAYCLMDNHVHLLLETPRPNLGAGMQRLHGLYAQSLNARYGRSGHVFQGRFGSRRVKDDPQLWTTVRYIALNPAQAGLGDSPWNSHAAVLGDTGPPWLEVPRLLSYFGADGGDPLVRYRDFVR
jgi:putative transposase